MYVLYRRDEVFRGLHREMVLAARMHIWAWLLKGMAVELLNVDSPHFETRRNELFEQLLKLSPDGGGGQAFAVRMMDH